MNAANYNAAPRERHARKAGTANSPMPAAVAKHAVVSPATSLDDDEARAERRLQKIHTLSQRLSQYARGSDRRQVLRTLLDPDLYPRMHLIGGVSGVDDIAAAEREAAGERASLNGVKFLQVRSPLQGRTDDSYFLQTVREVCGHMCDMNGVDADPMALYGGLLLRLCRSASERDALEALTLWTSGQTGELLLLPLVRRHHRPDSTFPLAEPVELEMYVEGGNVHAKVSMRHELGLFRRLDLEAGVEGIREALRPWNGLVEMAQRERLLQRSGVPPQHKKKKGGGAADDAANSLTRQLTNIQYEALLLTRFSSGHKNFLRPWVYINADVVERINFGTGSSVRILNVSVPEDKNSGYVKK
ncbi:hypothetical protein ACHAW5_001970 [Stephanodiscus triporus]|uniref:Uncharacterized protein n=1 Tax=Stephanodiscus triporus TaxID=2934178 RepID=A0ABD3QU47_9STRA